MGNLVVRSNSFFLLTGGFNQWLRRLTSHYVTTPCLANFEFDLNQSLLNFYPLTSHLFVCHRNGAAHRERHCWHGGPSGSLEGKYGPNSLRTEDIQGLLRVKEGGVNKTGQQPL